MCRKINLHELLLHNRYESVAFGNSSITERIAWKAWSQACLHRKSMNLGNGALKSWVVNKIFKGWTTHRADLQFSKKTFNELWKEKTRNR